MQGEWGESAYSSVRRRLLNRKTKAVGKLAAVPKGGGGGGGLNVTWRRGAHFQESPQGKNCISIPCVRIFRLQNNRKTIAYCFWKQFSNTHFWISDQFSGIYAENDTRKNDTFLIVLDVSAHPGCRIFSFKYRTAINKGNAEQTMPSTERLPLINAPFNKRWLLRYSFAELSSGGWANPLMFFVNNFC